MRVQPDLRPAAVREPRADAAVDYFDRHAEYYDANQYRTGRRTFMNARHDTLTGILGSFALQDGVRVLDAGCGPGHLAIECATRGWEVFALDAAEGMIAVAKANATRARQGAIQFQLGSIESLPYATDSFDLVCSAGVIEYLNPCDRAIAELSRVLKPGGLLVLPTTNLLAPAHWLKPLLDPISRVPTVAQWFGVRPGRYRTYFHYIPAFKRRLRSAALTIERERYFYLTVPRPLDRLFPTAARRIEEACDRHMDSGLRFMAEGYIAIARKAGRAKGA